MIQPHCEGEYVLIENWLTHPGEMDIQPFCIPDRRERIQSIVELLLKIIEGNITSELDLVHITEIALLDAPVLCGKGDYPFLTQRHTIAVRYAIDFLCESKEISLDVCLLTIVTDGESFELALIIIIHDQIPGWYFMSNHFFSLIALRSARTSSRYACRYSGR